MCEVDKQINKLAQQSSKCLVWPHKPYANVSGKRRATEIKNKNLITMG